MMSPPRLGLVTAIVTFVADQGSKLGLLFGYDLPLREPLGLGPNADLIVVWNRGISYGLFQQHSDLGRWILVVLSILATIAIAIWVRRTATAVLAFSLGLIGGGAIGNALDRVAYGAVFDFIHLHAGGYSWYVFNVADAAIVVGVAGLLYDSLVPPRQRAGKA